LTKVRIITDSTADLPLELAERYGIIVVPLQVFFGAAGYRDGIDLTKEEFFQRLAVSSALPTTSQPAPADFAAVYRPLLEEGAEAVSIHISSLLSGTVQSAQLAKNMLNYEQLEIIDSQTVSVILGMIVLGAARAAEAGYSKNEVVALVRRIIADHKIFFMVDTLEYLQRGGRIGKAQAFLGAVMNVKPICTIKDGIVYPQEKVRGRNKALARVVQLLAGAFHNEPVFCCMAHGNDYEGLAYAKELVQEHLNCAELLECQLGSVVGTHGGPGIQGIAVCRIGLMHPEESKINT